MISEHEEMMSERDLNNPLYFPKYILIRSESGNDGGNESH